MTVTKFNPEEWLETAVRGIKDYAQEALNDAYEVVMEFPGPRLDSRTTPWDKTIVHFEIDAQDDFALGFGDAPAVWNYSEAEQGVFPQWAAIHHINFDVGVWACDASGGLTSRLRAKQYLQEAFGFPSSVTRLREATNNDNGQLEIVGFSGGRYIIDTVNDFRVYRTVDLNLEIRVFSRTRMPDEAGPAIEEIYQRGVFFISDEGELVELPATGVPSLGTVQTNWQWVAGAVSAPFSQTGRMGVNNDSASLATQLWMHKIDSDSTDWSNAVQRLGAGNFIYVQQKNLSATWDQFRITGDPVLNGDTWVIPVTHDDGSPTEPTNNAAVLVIFPLNRD